MFKFLQEIGLHLLVKLVYDAGAGVAEKTASAAQVDPAQTILLVAVSLALVLAVILALLIGWVLGKMPPARRAAGRR